MIFGDDFEGLYYILKIQMLGLIVTLSLDLPENVGRTLLHFESTFMGFRRHVCNSAKKSSSGKRVVKHDSENLLLTMYPSAVINLSQCSSKISTRTCRNTCHKLKKKVKIG